VRRGEGNILISFMYHRLLFWVRRLLLARHQPSHERRTLRDRGPVHDHGKDDGRAVRGQIVSLQAFHRLGPEVKIQSVSH
jgi:hypothetical protein